MTDEDVVETSEHGEESICAVCGGVIVFADPDWKPGPGRWHHRHVALSFARAGDHEAKP